MAWSYAWNELVRRWSRTVLTALGLAAGVGLVIGIIGVSNGLDAAQGKILSPLSSVGTDIIVTRTVGATSSSGGTTTTTTPSGGGLGLGGGGGGGFFGGGIRGQSASALAQLNASDEQALLQANSTVITDLSKLGPPGTQFTYDFFVPGTLITFPDAAVQAVAGLKNVTSAVPGLSLQALHESGTVPTITASITEGSQTVTQTVRPPPLTADQLAQVQACLQQKGIIGGSPTSTTTPSTTAPGSASTTPGSGSTSGGGGGFGGGGRGAFGPAFTECLPASYQQYIASVTVPARTIEQVLNPPQTNTATQSYTVAGVDPSSTRTGLITKAQLVSGTWFTPASGDEVLVSSAYASTKSVKVGQVLPIDGRNFTVVGLVNPTLTGNTADLYFDLKTLQSLSSNTSRVNEVLVAVKNASDVSAVTAEIEKALPGAQVLTSKSLANQVSGSLSDARKLAHSLGTALAVIILLAAFLIAALLTLSSISKRVREIGTLRAIGWSRGRVVRQVVVETVGIGIIGAAAGVGVGVVVCVLIGALGPTLTSTSSGAAVGASSVGSLFHQATTASATSSVKLRAPIDLAMVGLGILFAVVGGLLAGVVGGWRAARMEPVEALRNLG